MQANQLVRFFNEQFFIPDLQAGNREEALNVLVQPLVDSGQVRNKDLVLEILNKRETLGSTGIGKGIAIPHCRTLVTSDIHIVIGISAAGIPYNAVDNKNVHIFFLIIAPPMDKSNLYLPILGKIVETVRDAKTRKTLLKASDFSTFLQIMQGG